MAVLFMAGFALFGFMNASVTYFVEVTGKTLKVVGINCFLASWALGEILLSLLLSKMNGWKALSFYAMGLPMLVSALFFRFMKESPRFLVVQEKFEDAKESLRNIGKINEKTTW